MKKLLPIIVLGLSFLSSCESTKHISSGVRDNKPLLFNNEYELSKLKELNLEGESFWGFPKASEITKSSKKNRAMIFTFNGVRIAKTGYILPSFGILMYTLSSAILLREVFGFKTVDSGGYYSGNTYYPNNVYKYRLPLVPAFIMAVPLAGTLNNFTFNRSALGAAGSSFEYQLIKNNPEVDVFYYPKYQISNKIGIWKQKAYLNAKVNGAKLIIK